LALKKFNFVIHAALILLACLRWNNQRSYDELAIALLAS